jgi:hypothetical protein
MARADGASFPLADDSVQLTADSAPWFVTAQHQPGWSRPLAADDEPPAIPPNSTNAERVNAERPAAERAAAECAIALREGLLREADHAMYTVKRATKSRMTTSSADLSTADLI